MTGLPEVRATTARGRWRDRPGRPGDHKHEPTGQALPGQGTDQVHQRRGDPGTGRRWPEGRADAWTDRLWVYDLRTNRHFTLKQKPIRRADFDEFIACYKPGRLHERVPTWSEDEPGGRWRCYDYDDLLKRDKLSLDLFWIKDEGLTDADSLPPPDVIAAEVADDLQAALEQFTTIAARLRGTPG